MMPCFTKTYKANELEGRAEISNRDGLRLSLYHILLNTPHMPGRGAIDTMPCYSAVTWHHDKAHSSTTMAQAGVIGLWALS